jgi:hypothetical protein
VGPGSAPIKTPDGQAELATRRRRVSQRHRTMLFLVDGRRSEGQVKALAAQAGVPESCFGELLDLGLIMVPQMTVPVIPEHEDNPHFVESQHIDLPLHDSGPPSEQVELAAAKSLQPESSLHGELAAGESWLPVEGEGEAEDTQAVVDAPLEEARDILLRAVRAEAPVAGSLTLMRLRRARSRADLEELLDEVEARIRKPHRMLATTQTMRRVRQLLGVPADSSFSAA